VIHGGGSDPWRRNDWPFSSSEKVMDLENQDTLLDVKVDSLTRIDLFDWS
jgi:hypothetical protein